jgi:RHS repeat-associated protein
VNYNVCVLGRKVYEHLEYTPYGELWVDRSTAATGNSPTPFRFTGKEFDPETGLYYYGARYLDPKTSRWISADPAMGEYVPQAPVNDEAKRYNKNLPGMGGVFNTVNLHVYHYAGNNPVKLIDSDGEAILGYEYDKVQVIFYMTPDTLQKYFGYYDFYEKHSNDRFLFRIDSLHIGFESGGETYFIRAWKGNYWGADGGEMGIYSGEGHGIKFGYNESGSGSGNVMIKIGWE